MADRQSGIAQARLGRTTDTGKVHAHTKTTGNRGNLGKRGDMLERKLWQARSGGAKGHERLADGGDNLSLRRYEAEYLKDQDLASKGRRGRGNP